MMMFAAFVVIRWSARRSCRVATASTKRAFSSGSSMRAFAQLAADRCCPEGRHRTLRAVQFRQLSSVLRVLLAALLQWVARRVEEPACWMLSSSLWLSCGR